MKILKYCKTCGYEVDTSCHLVTRRDRAIMAERRAEEDSRSSSGYANGENLRAENARLRKLLQEADLRIVEHHSCTIMRDEYNVCPICTKDGLLGRLYEELRADAVDSHTMGDQPRQPNER